MKMQTPWLTKNGRPVRPKTLYRRSRTWTLDTWEQYLETVEGTLVEQQLPPYQLQAAHERTGNSIHDTFSETATPWLRRSIGEAMADLPPLYRKVLRRFFFEGRTLPDIAEKLNISCRRVCTIKDLALQRLRPMLSPIAVHDFPIMREQMHSQLQPYGRGKEGETRLPRQFRKEGRVYRPESLIEEFEAIEHEALKAALRGISDRERKVLYLHYWCDYPMGKVARELGLGINVANNICDAAVLKLKRKIIQIESRIKRRGRSLCG